MWLIMLENTFINSSYICQKSRLYLEIEIEFEAHKEPTVLLDVHFICNRCLGNLNINYIYSSQNMILLFLAKL